MKRIHVRTRINGEDVEFLCEPRQSLLEVLRDVLFLTGTKEGCNNGNCGACNVIMNGRLVNSCLVMGAEAQGAEITTIEGIAQHARSAEITTIEGIARQARSASEGTADATGPRLHPLQQAFLEQAALQCGICTPGFIVAAKALLDRNPNPTEHDVRLWLAGNLCRCTGYDKIVRAVLDAAATSDGMDR